MSVNALIARGVAPIGQDLPQIGNMLMQRQQMQKQNALAEMAARTDQTRANAFASQVQGQQQGAAESQRLEALQRSFDTAAQFPEVLPQFVSDLRQSIAPDLPDNASLPQIAQRLGLRLDAPAPAPVPFEQSDKFRELTLRNQFAVDAESRRAANESRIERLRQAAPQGSAAGPSPSSVEEFRFVQGLSPEQKEEFMRVKRGEERPSSGIEKRLMTVNDIAFKSRSNVERYTNIAQQMEIALPVGGVRAAWTEKLKETVGSEDAVTELRRDWQGVRFSGAIQNLPPGVATDKDIQLALSSFLPENANAVTVASFLRGMAKLEGLKADYSEFEADFLSTRGTVVGLNQAWKQHASSMRPGSPAQSSAGNVVDFGSLPP